MSSTDAQMLQRAEGLLSRVVLSSAFQLPKDWYADADRWLSQYHRGHAEQTRWRPIDPEGNIDPQPAPEAPDDPDEGETGPPETELGQDPGEHDPVSAVPSEWLDGTDGPPSPDDSWMDGTDDRHRGLEE